MREQHNLASHDHQDDVQAGIGSKARPEADQSANTRQAGIDRCDNLTIFDNVELIIGDTLDVASNAAAMQEKARQVARYVTFSAGARQDVAATLLQIISGVQAYTTKSCGDKAARWFDGRCSCDNANWCRAAGNYSRFIEQTDTPLAR